MKLETTQAFLRACHEAKHIVDRMPPLPQGLTPRHLYVMETISDLSARQDMVRVSDISARMGVTKPSVTKLINELVSLDMVEKKQHSGDRRVFTLTLTEKGAETFRHYGTEFHSLINEKLTGLTEADVAAAIHVIHVVAAAEKEALRELEGRRV